MSPLDIFADMDSETMRLLQPLLEPFTCYAGTVVLRQGTPADHIYLIAKGKVEVSYKPYDGTAITVSILEKHGIFGWSAVVGSSKYTSSATAIEDLEAYRINGSDLRKLCNDHPEAARDILERLASAVSYRWEDAHEQIKAMLIHGMHV
jgi:CRP/FNR family transcriptional regulator, nitrogen oxide reductase regulator